MGHQFRRFIIMSPLPFKASIKHLSCRKLNLKDNFEKNKFLTAEKPRNNFVASWSSFQPLLVILSYSWPVLLYQVDSKDSLWKWIENDLLPSLYNTKWYNGQPFEYKEGFISDKQTFMMGMPRLRQQRVKKGEFGLCLVLKHTNLIDVYFQNISLLFWLAQIQWLVCHTQPV